MTGSDDSRKVASSSGIPAPGDRLFVEVDGREIAIFNVEGEFHAVANFCPHQLGPLCEGELTGHIVGAEDGWDWCYAKQDQVVKCPWHSWKFDITTGENVKDERYRVPIYEVELRDGDLYLNL